MYPRFSISEEKHRANKRRIEAQSTISVLEPLLSNKREESNRIKILECGSGGGYQSAYYQSIGEYFGIDVRFEKDNYDKGCSLIRGSIANIPIENSCFDIVAANHVIEHLPDLDTCLRELYRIGVSDCIYLFAVPTRLWLVLSIPAYYWGLVREKLELSMVGNLLAKRDRLKAPNVKTAVDSTVGGRQRGSILIPKGHGVHQNWRLCFFSLGLDRWRKLFLKHNFRVVGEHGLALYGPSEFPVVPTLRLEKLPLLASSYLFVLEKAKL